MSFISVYYLQRPTRAIHVAAKEISLRRQTEQYLVNDFHGRLNSVPANYHLAVCWCRYARIYRALELLAPMHKLDEGLMERIAHHYACYPGRWQTAARTAIQSALAGWPHRISNSKP